MDRYKRKYNSIKSRKNNYTLQKRNRVNERIVVDIDTLTEAIEEYLLENKFNNKPNSYFESDVIIEEISDFMDEDFIDEDFMEEDFMEEDFMDEDFMDEDFMDEDFMEEKIVVDIDTLTEAIEEYLLENRYRRHRRRL